MTPLPRLDLAATLALPLDGRTKGLPVDLAPTPLGAIAKAGWRCLSGDIPTPFAVLRQSALDHNQDWMNARLAALGAVLAPHGKTPMSPQIFDRQIAAGAWGITVADARQARVAIEAGVACVLIANEVTDAAALRGLVALVEARPTLELLVTVDSLDGFARLAASGLRAGVLVERGPRRGGARSNAEAMRVARAVKDAGLRLVGVEGYEGVIGGEPAERLKAVDAALTEFVSLAAGIDATLGFDGPEIVLTAGGTAFFDRAAAILGQARLSKPHRVVIRSGCYLFHDERTYERAITAVLARLPDAPAEGLRPAIEIWGTVLSTPEPNLAIVNVGKRDIAHDLSLPVAKWKADAGRAVALPAGATVTELNDQHAFLVGAGPLGVGQLIGFGVDHPCTTFDKWRVLHVVNDDYVQMDTILTWF